jgi:hypothetical protein
MAQYGGKKNISHPADVRGAETVKADGRRNFR